MTMFKVHYEIDNSRVIMPVNAETPDEAANIIRKRAPGAIVTKVKVDKSDNVSSRVQSDYIDKVGTLQMGFTPFYEPGRAEKITEAARSIIGEIDYCHCGAIGAEGHTLSCVVKQKQLLNYKIPKIGNVIDGN